MQTRTQSILFLCVSFYCLCFFLLLPLSSAHAQATFSIPDTIRLTAEPTHPGPKTETTISLDDYSVDTVGARITWYENGIERVDNVNERSIQVTTGKLGEKKTIKATITRTNAPTLSATMTLAPTIVDIILESDTYTPAFYKGRALPSMDAPVRAVALVHTGNTVPASSYAYTWRLDTTVLGGGAIRGKNIIDFTMPRYDKKVLSVQVFDQTGTLVGKASAVLKNTEPEILFYEHSALRGLRERTLSSPLPLIADETTIYGEPYFMQQAFGARSFAWTIDGASVPSDPGVQNAITLRRIGTEGSASIGLSVTTVNTIPQHTSNILNVFFQ